jgi:hypothetical protein
MHAEHVGPELFVAERVEAKNRLSVSMLPLVIFLMSSVSIAAWPTAKLLRGCRLTESEDDVRQ